MQIGVIGSGIAGLVACRLLKDSGHQITLFEKLDSIGIDAHSIDIADEKSGASVRADVPSRMFNQHHWPELWRLYERIGVVKSAVETTQSFGELSGPTQLILQNAARPSLGSRGLMSSRNREVLKEAKRLQQAGSADLDAGLNPSITLSEYLDNANYSSDFVRGFLYPTLSSTVFTCSYKSLSQYPAVCVLATLRDLTIENSQLFRSAYGTQDVARKLIVDVTNDTNNPQAISMRLGCGIKSVQRSNSGVSVKCETGEALQFDHLVMATQANSALGLIRDLSAAEKRILESFTYETIPVYVHTDANLMPPYRKDWSTFNMLSASDKSAAICTVWLNRFHDNWDLEQPVFQSFNAFAKPAEKNILQHSVMQRPLVNSDSLAALDSLNELHADVERRIWFCGSYASPGTPLLESGVRSSQTVAGLIERVAKARFNTLL